MTIRFCELAPYKVSSTFTYLRNKGLISTDYLFYNTFGRLMLTVCV